MKPPLAPDPVKALWPENPRREDHWSRSLWFERFPDPSSKDDKHSTPRRNFLEQGCAFKPLHDKPRAWLRFLRDELKLDWDKLLFAQLQARLLINAGGGVMENAGLALDRFSGQPFVPGSAVKGCARRYAVEQLVERGTALLPRPGQSSPATEAAELERFADEVVLFLKVFGWADHDWAVRGSISRECWETKRSDLAFACGGSWETVRERAGSSLAAWLGVKPTPEKPLWKLVPNFAGGTEFLPAHPVHVSLPEPHLDSGQVGKLELDLLAAHHRKYHEGTDPEFATAPDTEDPNLVFFPAVAAGQVFVFTVLGGVEPLLSSAREWLKEGLELLGLGAKTGSGYGWFREVSQPVVAVLARQEELAPWRKRAEGFAGLSEVEKEREALTFLGEGVWELVKGEPAAKTLAKFLHKREGVLSEAILPWLLKSSAFSGLAPEAQAELALELSYHTDALAVAQTHFPHSLAAAVAYLQANALWPEIR